MHNNNLVSVVVLCYNHAQYVVECLDSVISQSYTNWELIVADDASKDDSVEVIAQWMIGKEHLNIRTNIHEKNTGIGSMLNECIDRSNGYYLKFISADDALSKDFLAETVHFFEQNDHDFGVVFSNAQYMKSDSTLEDKYLVPPSKKIPTGWIRKELQFSNFIPAPAVLIKKTVYDKIGKYNPEVLIDDFDCWLRASLYFKFHYINKALVYYRIHNNNISHNIDFPNDMIELLMHHDVEGDFAEGINQKIRDHYYLGNTKPKAIKLFFEYPFRDKWMSWCIKAKVPYKLYRLIDKIFINTTQ